MERQVGRADPTVSWRPPAAQKVVQILLAPRCPCYSPKKWRRERPLTAGKTVPLGSWVGSGSPSYIFGPVPGT